MRLLTLAMLGFLVGCQVSNAVDLGSIDQDEPPSKEQLVVPRSDDDVERVGLRAIVTGRTAEGGKARVYLLINPLSNPDTRDAWWVQEEVTRDGDIFRGSCQFGEGMQGAGEYFAVVAVTTDRELPTGGRFQGLPTGMTYSRLKIVKRG